MARPPKTVSMTYPATATAVQKVPNTNRAIGAP
jgi:hypothetical protein